MLPDQPSALTAFQIRVAQMFFALPTGRRFLLAGGAALLAQHLSQRPTDDLDFFTRDPDDVPIAKAELVDACAAHGWHVEELRNSGTFCRLLIHGPDDLLVDLAYNGDPQLPATASFAGPTFAPEELAGMKLLALWDRTAARDFADVFVLARLSGTALLLKRATQLDAGLDAKNLAAQLRQHQRLRDADFPSTVEDVGALRAFADEWADGLDPRN